MIVHVFVFVDSLEVLPACVYVCACESELERH